MTTIVIILILSLMGMTVAKSVQAKMEKTNCVTNLKTLHVASNAYMTDHRRWPQIPYKGGEDKTFPVAWIKALDKYGVSEKGWICPTIQRGAGDPDYTKPEHVRVDYIGTPFDGFESSPYKWANQPWFIEKGAPHGRGNLMIFKDGRVEELFNFSIVQ